MLGAPGVLLQAQPAARLHRDALDLIARAGIDIGEAAPGPVGGGVGHRFGPAVGAQVFDQGLDVLGGGFVRHQHRVVADHHHHVAQPDHRQQPLFAAQVGIADPLQGDVAAHHVAGVVLVADVPQRRPRPDIGPADVEWHHGALVGGFHYRVVDGDVGRCGEGRGVEAQEIEVAHRRRQGRLGGGEDGRVEALDLIEIGARRH